MSLRESLVPAGGGCQDCHSTRPLAAAELRRPGTRTPARADDAAEVVADAEMPPRRYLLVHPDAALSDADRQVLVEALEAMDRDRGGGDRSGPDGGGDDDAAAVPWRRLGRP